MSFSEEIKRELAGRISQARHCQIAELAAMRRFGGGSSAPLFFVSEHSYVAEVFSLLLRRAFHLQPAMQIGKGRRQQGALRVVIRDEADAERILQATDAPIIQKECCRRAYLRGAFLVAGTVSDPNRSYHFEISSQDASGASYLQELIATLGIRARITERKGSYIVYIKESEDISDLLGHMGARVGLMNLANARILKEMREDVNRRVNCETANIKKTATAAARQIEAIREIEERIGLSALPNGLDEMARLRVQYPEATLEELGDLLSPPIGKSGVNHRLRRIVAIAKRLDEGS